MNILTDSAEDIAQAVESVDKPLDKAILSVVQGISPVITRELEHRVYMGATLASEIEKLASILRDNNGTPTMILKEKNTPADTAFMDITQYGDAVDTKHFDSFSQLLDSFYYQRDMAVRMKSRSQDLHKLVANTIERLSKKINIQTHNL